VKFKQLRGNSCHLSHCHHALSINDTELEKFIPEIFHSNFLIYNQSQTYTSDTALLNIMNNTEELQTILLE
jgi:hypothetical protein